MTAADVVTAVTLPLGALFAFVGTVGLVRFPTLLGRVHAATKPDTVALVLILIGAACQLPDVRVAALLALAALFQMLTVPVLAQTIGRVAYSRGETSEEHMVGDELAEALERDDRPEHRPGRLDEPT
ncbi:monovalent cation/H(+) antiporter subunit G [Streptomonospora nanhaiensis]|uniref:Multicomponent Na+:H+ antiporter subunit G n=1 Tax=Streptomonospora nanhaiensis TaxID=1323731 RepID=A0A853BU64_9ACTN|nr:monovalent cation/H(+) antiporter subunit G [Streptomonospora nanhaiensis]MBV2363620.1 monovalent cation/H(+) antiporter subunit G [Streptomonospora nanhaiensis]MBX9390034.1 monovalent cation/H(+) antiporter subunit G [Streptomonospora nanhaiensis]NYI98663.1 multicomponent Na+:H+ antiporter subunit G [Streptomonospora nanhaiensis]